MQLKKSGMGNKLKKLGVINQLKKLVARDN